MDETSKPAAAKHKPAAKKAPAAKPQAPAVKAEAVVETTEHAGVPVNPRLPGGRVPRTAKR